MNRRRLLATLSSVSVSAGLPIWAGAAIPLQMITSPIDAGAQPYYCQDLGFFRDAGIEAEVVSLGSGAVVLNAVVAKSAQIGFANLASLAIAFKRGIPITVVAPGSFYDSRTPTSLLLVSKTSPIRTAADLNGKTIAAAGLGTIVEWAPRIWMDKNGGDSSSVRFVEMNMSVMTDAIASGRIDASVVTEPFLAEVRPQARVLAAVYDAIAPRFTIGVFFANADWAHANVDAVSRFRTAIVRSAIWANSHHDESAKILMAHSKIAPEIAQQMVRIGYEDRLNPKQMQPLIDLVARYGGMDGEFPAEQLIFKA
jgi:NitT/TauT family transport system substrate-binding protein